MTTEEIRERPAEGGGDVALTIRMSDGHEILVGRRHLEGVVRAIRGALEGDPGIVPAGATYFSTRNVVSFWFAPEEGRDRRLAQLDELHHPNLGDGPC
jgi:hypothetical protein